MRIFGRKLELIIFDVDGVIIDILAGLKENIMRAARDAGLPTNPVEKNFEDIRAGMVKARGNARAATAAIWPGLSPAEIDEFLRFFYAHERINPYPLLEGAEETISRFRSENIPVALATNNPYRMLELRLSNVNVDLAWFAAVATGDDAYRKPHPMVFDSIFKKVPVPREQSLFVGDLEIDWECACDAGVPFAAVLTGGLTREMFTRAGLAADRIFNCVSDLIDVLEIEI